MARENLVGRTLAGYQLQELIGEGGTASVYRSLHAEKGTCAVKVLRQRLRTDATAVKRFLREAGYGSRVQNPHVVQTYDYGEEDGFHYLALEWAAGEPLSDYVDKNGPAPATHVTVIITQLADALAAAHAAGIIHRDLKPENIMFDADKEVVKLLDFGIARDADLAANERLTRTGFFVGTLHYVAPEALSGELVSEAADIYSLATITYYLLTRAHPYQGRSPRELFQQLLTEDPTPLNRATQDLRFSSRLEAAVMKALSREPAGRHATVRAFAADLAAAIADGGEVPVKRGFLGAIKGVFQRNKA